MIKILNIILSAILAFSVSLTVGFLTWKTQTNVGSYSAAADYSSSLASEITSSATSLTVVSTSTASGEYLEQGRTYGLKLGGREYVSGVLSPGKQFTSLTRGLSLLTGTSTGGVAESWGRGTSVEITDAPLVLELSNQISGRQNITDIMSYSPGLSFVPGSNQIASVAYVDAGSNNGAATSTETNGGIVELATQQEMASSTNATAIKPLVMQSKYATSSPYTTGMWSPVTDKDGKLNQTFWRLTDNFTFLGRFTTSGTTTIPASSVTNNALNLNGQNYAIQSTRGAASTTLMEDGSGNLTWVNPDFSIIASTTLTSAVSTTTLSFAGRNDLRIIIDVPVMTGTTVLDIIFNSDTAANYGWHLSNNLAAFEGGNTQKAIVLSPSAGLTNVGYYHNLNVTNQGGRTKRILWNGQAYIDNASNQNFLLGDANYTSTSKLTSISVGSQGVQLPANTRIIIYGSPN